MRRIIVMTVLAALSVIALLVFVPTAGAQQDSGVMAVPVNNAWSVSIGDNFFAPADIAIEPGDTITWTNEGAVPHTVTADDGSFDSETLNPGDSFTVAFSGQGTLTYYCEIHPEMVGSVTVGGGGDASAEPPTPAAPTESMPMETSPGGSGY